MLDALDKKSWGGVVRKHTQRRRAIFFFFFLSHKPIFKVVGVPPLRTDVPIESTIHSCVRLPEFLQKFSLSTLRCYQSIFSSVYRVYFFPELFLE